MFFAKSTVIFLHHRFRDSHLLLHEAAVALHPVLNRPGHLPTHKA
ncbi:hypothetical protein SFK272_1771 [Shigella flexneri K-272]|nr:hypothetical protein SFK272_1771 [Shigella flexneri K-272]